MLTRTNSLIPNAHAWPEYKAIAKFYGERTAERSGIPLINHIDEGLVILHRMSATENTMKAWCLHPLFQNDDELAKNGYDFVMTQHSRAQVILLVMEYRYRANACLPGYDVVPNAGDLVQVAQMLIADKVQNHKDFQINKPNLTEDKIMQLTVYFAAWFKHLGVSEAMYQNLIEGL